jgi:Flp pilus assembly protein TadD
MLADSLTSFERAIEIEPDNSVVLNNLGITLKSLGRVDDAIKSFAKAIDIAPDNPLGHFNLGLALRSH